MNHHADLAKRVESSLGTFSKVVSHPQQRTALLETRVATEIWAIETNLESQSYPDWDFASKNTTCSSYGDQEYLVDVASRQLANLRQCSNLVPRRGKPRSCPTDKWPCLQTTSLS